MDITHLIASVADKCTHQPLRRTLSIQMLNQCQQRSLSRIQSDVIHIITDAGLSQLTQLSINVATTKTDFDIWVV